MDDKNNEIKLVQNQYNLLQSDNKKLQEEIHKLKNFQQMDCKLLSNIEN